MAKGEVAVVGYACRMAGARDSKALWHLLRENRCSVTSITPDRFPTQPYFHPDHEQRGRSFTFAAGVIDDVWGFDATAFGMSPREAEQVDPQHRHLLEVTHDALAHAGIRPSSLQGSPAGVYIGASSADHALQFFVDPTAADMHMMTGNSLSIMANRISYTLDLRGPSLTLDTACSSSMVALDMAAEAIRSGSIDTAIVGGVNLILSPFSYVGFSRASMLSPTGLCRPFDAAADGYVRAEGAVVVVLRSMAAARKANNRIHGVIVGSGVNQDGRTTGLSLPSAESQRALLDQVYGDFGIDPADLSFVEAHGTGTPVGDPIEADALGKGLGQRRSRPLPIGSVKSNVGHLEPVSGLAGLLKSMLALEHGLLPATLHQESPNPNIPLEELNLEVVGVNRPLPRQRAPELVGVNSFGFGGTNAHTILRSDRAVASLVQVAAVDGPPPLMLTAHTADALPALAAAYLEAWPPDERQVAGFLSASAYQRDALSHRLIVLADNAEETRQKLELVARGEKSPRVLTDQALGTDLPVTFLFSGNGAQWAGMGRDAWAANPAFREALRDIDRNFARVQDWSIVDLLFADDLAPRLRHATVAQPLLLALQIATVRALEEGGLAPAAVAGHSVGEIAAAWCAGILSLEQAIDVVSARSRHQEAVRGAGGMAALMLSEREASRFLSEASAAGVEIAAVNSWRSVTVSGPEAEIDQVLEAAAQRRISARRLDLDYPFHSALVEPVEAPLKRALEGLRPQAVRRRFVSTVPGAEGEDYALDADHWWRNVRAPVRFEAALATLLGEDHRIFVEIGPRPILASYVRDVLREAGERGAIFETLTEAEAPAPLDPIERCVARVALAGGQVNRQRFFGAPPPETVALPLYPWQHAQFKVRTTDDASTILTAPGHALLGLRQRLDAGEWYSTLDPLLFPWMADHKVGGATVLPATAYVEILLAAAREVHGDGALELREFDIFRPLVFDGRTSLQTKVRLARETGVVEFLSRPRTLSADWTLNARGIVARSPVTGEAQRLPTAPNGSVIVPRPRVYACAQDLGFEYGPTFQRMRQVVFPGPKIALGTLDRPAELLAGSGIIDLAALDAGFHALFASEEAGVADMPMRRMLPVRFASVRVFEDGVLPVRVTARTLRQSPTSILVDMDLWDERDRVVVSARGVRLIDAPADLAVDPGSLSYRLTPWQLDAAGAPAPAPLAAPPPLDDTASRDETGRLVEGLLLVEAGSLRAAWSALRRAPPESGDAPPLSTLMRNALLAHLEPRGLAIQANDERAVTPDCTLPEAGAIIHSLLVRHPTMAAEAASLARLEDLIGRLLDGDPAVAAEFAGNHWKQLGMSSAQADQLRQAVAADIAQRLGAVDTDRLLRLLMVGAQHLDLATDLCRRFPNLEIALTDADDEALEQARALLGEDTTQVRPVAWTRLADIAAASIDGAIAVDALGELAATRDGLERITRLLRPNAPVVAAELTPSLFWDIVRGARPNWWVRSATADFPVGTLLTAQEWVDELEAAGLWSVTATPVGGDARVGILLRGLAGKTVAPDEPAPRAQPVFHWTGSGAGDLAALVDRRLAAFAADPVGTATATDLVLAAAIGKAADPAAELSGLLTTIAEQCRSLGEATARYWVVLDFGPDGTPPLEQPLWCAVTAALRVAQNEHAGLEIRCIGLAGDPREAVLERAAAELLLPGPERDVFVAGHRRVVFRVERGGAPPEAVLPPGPDSALKLVPRPQGARGSLTWVTTDRRMPEAGEVEIAVESTGLNFRDVMWNLRLLPEEALEDGYAGPGLGMECAGTVTRVGPDVAGLSPGDRVMAFARDAFASHVVAPSFAVCPLPEGLSPEAATTLPVAFLTAYYALAQLGRLADGEVVLIHGGAGAVGLAALQVAKSRNAIVIASAGSEEKRALLREVGADLVCNSRTLSFADEVLAFTGGKGVDVVLNSLAGDAMVRSLDCLKPFGRFLELGKRDFFANTQVGMRPFRRNLSYFGVDVDQLLAGHRDLAERMFRDVVRLFAEGTLVPLPYRTFAGDRVADAFRLMQRSGHIGKIVLKPATRASIAATSAGTFPVDASGTHVVIGGTSGFGLATAAWLASRGARTIVLASRSARLSEVDEIKVQALSDAGVDVEIARVDVADLASLQQFLRGANARTPIKGIVNAAMVLDDRLMQGLDRDAIEAVLGPKVGGALNIERLAADFPLDYVLLFSSATTLFGNPGQFNYVAANGFAEATARRMRARGLPALAVAWGAIEDAGYLERNMKANAQLKKRFASTMFSARTALDGLDWAFDAHGVQRTSCLAIARIDWATAKRELPALRAPTFAAIETAAAARHGGYAGMTLDELRAMPAEEATAALLEIIVGEIARVVRLPPKEVDRHRPLMDIGMDSLMMLELRTTVETALQIDLPMMSLASGITPADVARRIAPLVLGDPGIGSVPATLVALSTSHLASEIETAAPGDALAAVNAVLDRMKQLDGSR